MRLISYLNTNTFFTQITKRENKKKFFFKVAYYCSNARFYTKNNCQYKQKVCYK